MARTHRLFELLAALRARRTPVTAAELARDLHVSLRTVYRDIDTLRSLGAPIGGQAGYGFCLGEGFFLPEFAFSPDERDALVLGLEWVRQRADPALAEAGERALAKVLSTNIDGAHAPGEPPSLISAASRSKRFDPAGVFQLREAIRRQRKIAIGYEDARGVGSERIVWPLAVVYFDEVRILAAWCERRSDFRHFRVDRLEVKATMEDRYPGRRRALMAEWRRQDRDWRSLLTTSGTPAI